MTEATLHRVHANPFWQNFLGHSPEWYKLTIVGFLILNPLLLITAGPYVTGWCLVLEFIFTLAMALKCYPLQPGGLLAIEALVLGLTDPHTIEHEVELGFPVILLLIFMVAGIFFMKELLLFIFTKLLILVRSKILLSVLFCAVAAVLSAFLDALTVTAVVISVAGGFYAVYNRIITEPAASDLPSPEREPLDDLIAKTVASHDVDEVLEQHRHDLQQFRAFLRNLTMHAAVGTALGGVMTTVGEPQNLLISKRMEWEFIEFFLNMAPVTLPVFVVGIATCVLLEVFKVFSYGARIPPAVLTILRDFDRDDSERRTNRDNARLVVQALAGVVLVFALAFHVIEVGLVGLSIIVLQTAFNGIVQEHRLGRAFEEALPFTALLCVFFGIVAVIAKQDLFYPVITFVLSLPLEQQPGMFYIANGVLSAISDNVFVATVYINEVKAAFDNGTISREQFDLLGVAINTGTNIPSVATPNGQAAFLFLLTSSLAPLIRLSYGRMVFMALPYTITMGIAGWYCVTYLL